MTITSEKPRMNNFGFDLRELTFERVITEKARLNGDRTFLTFLGDGRTYSYRQVEEQSARIANGLLAKGLGKGSHIAVVMDNCPEQMLLYFAIGRIGGVSIPINTAAKGKLLTHFLHQSDSVAVILQQHYVELINEVIGDVPAITQMIVLAEPGAKPVLPLIEGVTVADFAELEAGSAAPPGVEVRFTDLAGLAYTSGTTGPSKGNMMVQAAIIQVGMTTAESQGYRATDTIYVSLPINHSNGYTCCLWGAYMADAQVALSRRFSVSRYWSEIRQSGSTITNLLGSMCNMLWTLEPTPQDLDNKMRVFVCTPVPKFALEFEARYGCRVTSSYGLTDYVMGCHYTVLDPVSKLGSCGRPRAGIELRIVDEDGIEVADGEVGELVMRSNNPYSGSIGYYKMPEATAASMRGLWFHTGDAGWIDKDGYFWIADRLKDALRRRGENISAQEVESVIMDHPAIAEAAVYAVKSDMAEDEVGVSIVIRSGLALTEPELIEFCATRMAHFMVPRYVHFAPDLPRTESHKVQKAQLRQFADNNRDKLWDREASGIVLKR